MATLNPAIWQLSKDGQFWEMREEVAVKYRAASATQLKLWLAGESTHSKVDGFPELTECCPDFSCCGSTMWDSETRKRFTEATEETRQAMLGMSLSELALSAGATVQVLGENPTVN